MSRSAVQAAFHEAGHFVAHHYLVPSEAPVRVAIFDDGEGYFTWDTPPAEPLDVEKTRGRLVAIYAGAAADARLDPAGADAARAGARHDDERAAKCLERLGETDGEAEYRERARIFVADHWREIEAVAMGLLELEMLRGDVAEMVLRLANGADVESAVKQLARSLAPEAATEIVRRVAARLALGTGT